MNVKFVKRFSTALLAALLCISSVSCSEETAEKEKDTATVDTTETATFSSDPPVDTEELGELEEEIAKAEIFDEIPSWVGYSDDGPLKDKDACQTVEIKKASDLDPYRQFFPELTAEEEAEFLSDEKGYVLLLEITSKGTNHSYSTDSVYNNGVNIEILITEWEEPDPQPKHTFYLYYIPADYYNELPVRVLFL